ncbi:hypothetical protein BZA77DRAFT_366281 [Pyronema omphalodes]|nr:hypothetical protein BZA77DRAFT_366281 [Pyronema omphalodes]
MFMYDVKSKEITRKSKTGNKPPFQNQFSPPLSHRNISTLPATVKRTTPVWSINKIPQAKKFIYLQITYRIPNTAKPTNLKARSSRPEAQGQKLKARSSRPEAQGQKLKARSSRPEAQGQKLKARSSKLKPQGQKLKVQKRVSPRHFRKKTSHAITVPCTI